MSTSMTSATRAENFDDNDLRYLRRLLHEMRDDLRLFDETVGDRRDRSASRTAPPASDEMEIRLAAALLFCAKPGRRDDAWLKRQVLKKITASVLDLR